jgi:hypothetical protein
VIEAAKVEKNPFHQNFFEKINNIFVLPDWK